MTACDMKGVIKRDSLSEGLKLFLSEVPSKPKDESVYFLEGGLFELEIVCNVCSCV